VLKEGALQAGLSFLPMTLAVFVGSSLAPRLLARFGVRQVITAGMLVATAGLALFTGIRPGGSYFVLVLPGALLSGLGMGLALVSSTVAATQGVPGAQSGLASGLLNMSRLFGGALGLAVLSTIAAGATHPNHTVDPAQALSNGFALAFTVGAGITLLGAGIALAFLRPRPAATVTASAAHGGEDWRDSLAA
jgi:MFS family permease